MFRTVSITALGLLILLATGCASDKSTISSAVQANTQLQPAEMADPEINSYFQQMGARIIVAAKAESAKNVGPSSHFKDDSSWMFTNQIQFHLVNSKTLNAFTTGGQHVYVYNALFQMCQSEDELAAVMSHEFAHIYCRHVQQGTVRQQEMLVAAGGAGLLGYVYGGKDNGSTYAQAAYGSASSVLQYVGMGFTRGDEAQADEFGFDFYGHAGWNVDHFQIFFQRMIDAGYDSTPAVQSDHPTLKSRVVAAQGRAAQFKKQYGNQFIVAPIVDDQTFARIKAKAAQIAATTPDDASLNKAQSLLSSFSSCVAPVDQQDQVAARKKLVDQAKKEQADQKNKSSSGQ